MILLFSHLLFTLGQVQPVGKPPLPPVDFNRQIRPLLSDRCFSCHGPDAHARKGDLRLDLAEEARTAGAIVPGKPDQSTLVERIHATEASKRMPPAKSGKSLTPAEKEMLQRWIQEGGKYEPHWAYRPPVRVPVPVVQHAGWVRDPIDNFLLQRQEKEGISPAKDATPRELVRRLYLDMTGLLPGPEMVRAFEKNPTDAAWADLVDRLLASDAHAERMASWWLDLVRFADTVGYHGDQEHAVSPYRDWVIDAFATNMPFDRFTQAQIAGDLLPGATTDDLIASCYNRLLQTSHEGGVQAKEYRAIYAADRVRNLSVVWMGATVGCAQCHDHKYDPFTARDFYSLAAFFADLDDERHLRGGLDQSPTRREPEIEVHTRRERENLAKLDEARKAALQAGQKEKAEQLQKELHKLTKAKRRVMIAKSLDTPRKVQILPRGNWLDETGPEVQAKTPGFLPAGVAANKKLTRLDLAQWLCAPETGGGLTARVQVNRLWALCFGAGLTPSLEDFGGQVEPPTHPELLDHLALSWMDHGWDTRSILRRILCSRAYRQSSGQRPDLYEKDPENRLFAQQGVWRLSAEAARDTALQSAGLLNTRVGGPSFHPYQPEGYFQYLNFPKRDYNADTDDNQFRRGVYAHWQRQFLQPMLRALEAPSREECTASRPASTTPLTALALLNDPTCVEAARNLAARVLSTTQGDDDRLKTLFQITLQRDPGLAESQLLVGLLERSRKRYQNDEKAARQLLAIGISPVPDSVKAKEHAQELAAWTLVARAVLNLNENLTRE